jgi:hypothetical protein
MGAPLYLSNREIHEDLCGQLLTDHIRPLTDSFELKLADTVKPLVRQFGRKVKWPRIALPPKVQTESDRVQQKIRGHCLSVAKSTFRMP